MVSSTADSDAMDVKSCLIGTAIGGFKWGLEIREIDDCQIGPPRDHHFVSPCRNLRREQVLLGL